MRRPFVGNSKTSFYYYTKVESALPSVRVTTKIYTPLSSTYPAQRIKAYFGENQRVLDTQLSKVACSIRTSQHEVLGVLSYYANFERDMVTSGRALPSVGSSSEDVQYPEGIRERFRTLRADIVKKLEAAS